MAPISEADAKVRGIIGLGLGWGGEGNLVRVKVDTFRPRSLVEEPL